MLKKLTVSSSPHICSDEDTQIIMRDVILALMPALIAATFYFGLRVIVLTMISVISCVIFEAVSQKLMGRPITVNDLSAVITGILLVFCLPVSVPLWLPVIGSFVAIVIVKQLFGGIGKNFVNPALLARAVLMTWATYMTTGVSPLKHSSIFSINVSVDAITSATPLATEFLGNGVLPTTIVNGATHTISILDMFIGNRPGMIGETGILVLIFGAIYLLYRRVISWHIPAAYIGTVAIITFLFPIGKLPRLEFMLYEVMAGGLILGAFYMATDYSSSPVTKKGKLIYGMGCGLLTVIIRYFGGYPEGVSYAILIMNLLAFSFDKWSAPKRFGKELKANV